MKAVLSSIAILMTAGLFGVQDDRKPRNGGVIEKKTIPRDQIKLTDADWRPQHEIVFRAESGQSKECRQIGDGFACGLVPTLEVEEELRGEVKMSELINAHVEGARTGRAYNVRWRPSPEARENLALAAKGGYSRLWVTSERFDLVPESPDWAPTDEIVFRARYRRLQKFWGEFSKRLVSTPYVQFEVASILQGRLGVRRLVSLTPSPKLVDGEVYTFRWKPSPWTRGELKRARIDGTNEYWLMFWDDFERIAEAPNKK